ncbi:hypothetical protein L0F63_003852 [Massospora cicadina]|nr:hypothetical protein L0F63_003852 [Massospora cicadina]
MHPDYTSSDTSNSPQHKKVCTLHRSHSELSGLLDEERRLLDRIAKLEAELRRARPALNNPGASAANGGTSTPTEGKGFQLTHDDIDWKQYEAPEWALGKACQFDVILMDPPWQLATHVPTRGVAIGYQQLPDSCIEDLPIQSLQTDGFIFIWVINIKYHKAFELMERWGYVIYPCASH